MTKGAKSLNDCIQHIKIQQLGFITGKEVVNRLPGDACPIRQVNLAWNRLTICRGFSSFSLGNLLDIFFDLDAHRHATSAIVYQDYSLKCKTCQYLLSIYAKVIDTTVKVCYTLLQVNRIEKSGTNNARFDRSAQMKERAFACRLTRSFKRFIMMTAVIIRILPRLESWRKYNLKKSQTYPKLSQISDLGAQSHAPFLDSVANDRRLRPDAYTTLNLGEVKGSASRYRLSMVNATNLFQFNPTLESHPVGDSPVGDSPVARLDLLFRGGASIPLYPRGFLFQSPVHPPAPVVSLSPGAGGLSGGGA